MTTRSTRVGDLLETLHDTPVDTTAISDGRTIHKSELETLATTLEITSDATPTTTSEYRTTLRQHLSDLPTNKSGQSTFSKSELRTLTSALNTANRLTADTITPFLETCQDNNVTIITVNDTTYTITDYQTDRNMSDVPGYTGYITAIFETNKRLISFYNWDGTECYYDTSAALERQIGNVPYKRWKQHAYITQLSTPEQAGPNL